MTVLDAFAVVVLLATVAWVAYEVRRWRAG